MARVEFTKGVTPVGTAYWSHLLTTSQFQGVDSGSYDISLELSMRDEGELLSKIQREWDKFAESEEGRKHNYKYEPSLGFKEGKDGKPNLFKFKMRAVIKTQRGEWERHVPIYDAGCKEISKKIAELGNGSKIKVAYSLAPYYMNDKTYGVSLRLDAVQVLEYKTSEETAEGFGFGQETGFHAPDSAEAVEGIDVPFYDGGDEGEF